MIARLSAPICPGILRNAGKQRDWLARLVIEIVTGIFERRQPIVAARRDDVINAIPLGNEVKHHRLRLAILIAV